MSLPVIVLKPGKERPVQRFHPWVFSGAVARISGRPANGDLVEVRDAGGNMLGTGHYQQGSIAVRLLAFDDRPVDTRFWELAIDRCFNLRKGIGLPSPDTSLYRLVHGEGDGLPGLIVDVYGDTAVVQCHSQGMFRARMDIAQAIVQHPESSIRNVYDKSLESADSPEENSFLIGTAQPGVCTENGHRFAIDFITGQKTGFFIDQRDNRRLLAHYAAGRTVLNTFCYTGGFSVYALGAGAARVDSVDSSKKAIGLTLDNVALNGFSDDRHRAIVADVPEWLKTNKDRYDLIVLDPPAFAKHTDARHRAVQAYKRLNKIAMEQLTPNGILFTFSCSQVVSRELFRNTITAAAIESGREVSILHQLSQPADHPVSIYHPEGEYLKGLVLMVK